MSSAVTHFEVMGKDLGKLEKFYGELFGWKTQSIPEMNYAMVEKEGEGIAGGIGQTQDGGPGHVTFYVSTDDAQASLDKAVELGGTVVMPVTVLPQVTIALFADPEGHVIGLSSGM